MVRHKQYNFLLLYIGLIFREMMPPASTKTAVYQWNQKITQVSKEIGKATHRHTIFFG